MELVGVPITRGAPASGEERHFSVIRARERERERTGFSCAQERATGHGNFGRRRRPQRAAGRRQRALSLAQDAASARLDRARTAQARGSRVFGENRSCFFTKVTSAATKSGTRVETSVFVVVVGKRAACTGREEEVSFSLPLSLSRFPDPAFSRKHVYSPIHTHSLSLSLSLSFSILVRACANRTLVYRYGL